MDIKQQNRTQYKELSEKEIKNRFRLWYLLWQLKNNFIFWIALFAILLIGLGVYFLLIN